MVPVNIHKDMQETLIRVNDFIIRSEKVWLIKSYSLAREFLTYALSFPLSLLRVFSRCRGFIIYAQERTGSTLLVDLLNSNPHIHCDREVFALKVLFGTTFLQARRGLHPQAAYGCKVMGYQLERQVTQPCMRTFMHKMHAREWKIIYVARRNVLRQAISHLIMEMRGKAHLLAEAPAVDRRFHIDLSHLQERMRQIETYTARDKKALLHIPHLKLVYEDDLLKPANHQSTIDKVCSFLGTPTAPARTRLTRITSDRLQDFVQNFEEIESLLSKTPYAQFIDDDRSVLCNVTRS